MCGLAAIFAYRDSAPVVDRSELLRMREYMRRRGPDGAGLWISTNGRLGLAHRRLTIIDLSDAGAQPMGSPDGAIRIVFNGEIYNHRELRRELEAAGDRFVSTSDTEVLLHLYRRYGQNMVHRLRGMYAFAIWDEAKAGLFLARDPYGIKPLYYHDDGSMVRVASQVKALLAGGRIEEKLDPAGQVGYLLWGCVPEPHTLYRGVRAVPAGASLWVDHSGAQEPELFFNLTGELASFSLSPPRLSANEAGERLRSALLDTVRHHLVSDVPVSVFLSSGLDSTTLAALVKDIGIAPLRTITLGFREYVGTEQDEVALAEFVANYYGATQTTRWVSKEDFQSEFTNLLDAMDQPSIDGVNSYFISQAAAKAGHKVALSGLGGDELFGSYPSFKDVPNMVRSFGALRGLPALGRGFRLVTAPILKHFTSPKYAGLLEYGSSHGGAYLLRRGLFMPWELPEILGEDVVREGWEQLNTLNRLEQTTAGIGCTRLKMTALETSWYMRNQLLRDTDWASMAHSLEIRLPLVDLELLRAVGPMLASATPLAKIAMTRTPLSPLPADIVQRGKRGFSVPLRAWLHETVASAPKLRGLRGWALALHQKWSAPH